MKELNIAVKEMVYFLYSSGDLTRDTFQNIDPEQGKEAHKYIQNKFKGNDQKEYYIKYTLEAMDYIVNVKGYIDGVLNDGLLLMEIKSTYSDTSKIIECLRNDHLSQLKIYAYMYCKEKLLPGIEGRLLYVSIDDYQTKSFDYSFDIEELESFFFDSIYKYLEWVIKLENQGVILKQTISQLEFPFDNYRKGQRDFMKYIYVTIRDKDILYAIAPTGIGKTMATIFASLKSIGDKNKIFYLTAKSLGKSVAINAMNILKDKGLVCKSIELTNKDRSCLLSERNCDVEVCPYIKGYYDRLHQAIKELYDADDIWNFDSIHNMALKHKICPFEFSLDLSYYADVIIADYNYAFCPRTHLIRYFDDDTYKPILLVDEAHNLVDRSKDMYSASLSKSSLVVLRGLLSKIKPSVKKVLNDCINYIDNFSTDNDKPKFYSTPYLPDTFMMLTYRLQTKLEKVFKDNLVFKERTMSMNYYFDILKFNKISSFFNESFRFIYEHGHDDIFRISCLDASSFILNTINNRSFGTIFFSATMYPLPYYQNLLTEGKGESIIIPSPFNPDNLKIIVKNNVSTKYLDREKSVIDIIKTIDALISYKKGNYIVFFPSYEYLNLVYDNIGEHDYNLIIQSKDMTFEMRNETLNIFNKNDKTTVAFFVMGGSFAEGIDYIGDMLSGVLIISVCLPMISNDNDLLLDYFESHYQEGFNYAYKYPGFTKVVQAVGRVIRSETDKGVCILFDTRFNKGYINIMPKEWSGRKIINNTEYIKEEIEIFKGE